MNVRRTMPLWSLAPLLLAVGCSGGDDDDDDDGALSIPDQFPAAFVTGRVCMPTQIQTGADAKYAVKFETCVHRCVALDRSLGLHLKHGWTCSGGQCQMALLAYGTMVRVKGQEDCDPNDLPAPASSECTQEIVSFDDVNPPHCEGSTCDEEYPTGPFRIVIPYLDMAQGQEVVGRVSKGESMSVVLQDVAGMQTDPERMFVVDFDPSYASVNDPDALSGADCHDIPAP